MKIKSIKIYRLRDREHLMFMTEMKNTIEAIGPALLGIDCLFNNFIQVYNCEYKIFEDPSLSHSTMKRLEEYDEKSDNYYRGIELITKGFLRHKDPKVREAAILISGIIKKYGDIRYIPYEDAIILMKNFCLELKRYSSELKILHLEEWVEMLDSENNSCQYLIDTVKKELISLLPAQKIRAVRQQVDFFYKEIVIRINALLTLEGEDKYKNYIDRMNNIISKYTAINMSASKESRKNDVKTSPVIPEAFY